MSRIAKAPIRLPAGVQVRIDDAATVSVEGPKGSLSMAVHQSVMLQQSAGVVTVAPRDERAWSMAGTMRALLSNCVVGVSQGFQKKLELVGVGYRAQAKDRTLNLSLGLSHPVAFAIPKGITIETPSQTEIVITGVDKQAVGQVAADIRAYRPPEPYKGKGIRYAGESILRKEAKKK